MAGSGGPVIPSTFRAWAMNTRNRDVTEYTNFAFNSFALLNGVYYAAGPGGLYELTGDDDDGADIDARMRTGVLADGSGQLLKVPEILVQAATDEAPVVSVLKEDDSRYDYPVPYNGVETMQQYRVQPGKGLRGLGFRVEVANSEGGSLEVTALNVVLEKTARRLGDR